MEKNENMVAVVKTDAYKYPAKEALAVPKSRFPEYPFDWQEDCQHSNPHYGMVREAFYLLGMDKENFGTKEWNPLGDIINPGNTVLIKPNLVHHKNPAGSTECMYTQASVVAPVIDYVCIALKGIGKIVIGDAPVQECDFDILCEESGYKQLVDEYKRRNVDIELLDFRGIKTTVEKGVRKTYVREGVSGKVIDLQGESEFANQPDEKVKRLRITNYDPRILAEHHTTGKHEYCISDYVLSADVIINMPKPKSHRKAGATISLKNFVGCNVRKEYLPHHTMGSKNNGGDEYLNSNAIHAFRSMLIDQKNKTRQNFRSNFYKFVIKACSVALGVMGNRYSEGSWYGNETISKTVLDINKIILYADKAGNMTDKQQRKVLIVADMILSGEGEGPLMPTSKDVGIIAAGYDMVHFDIGISRIMGFDFKKIPTIQEAAKYRGRYPLTENMSETCIFVSNDSQVNGKRLEQISRESSLKFQASDGWIDNIELL